MTHPFFSVIIPTLNEEKTIHQILDALKDQVDRDFEVIISDSFSKDQTKKIAQGYQEKVPGFWFVEHKSKNVGMARNYGASLAKGNFLIFFDADVAFEPEFTKKIKELIILHNLDTLTVWNRPKEKGWKGKFILTLLNIVMVIFQKIKPSANGPCIIIKKTLFNQIKGFDETIVFGEDFDLIQKAFRIKAKFAVFRKPLLYVSARRFEKEGIFFSLYKSIKAILYQLFFGPIRKPIFEYKMGGHYYKESQNSNVKPQN